MLCYHGQREQLNHSTSHLLALGVEERVSQPTSPFLDSSISSRIPPSPVTQDQLLRLLPQRTNDNCWKGRPSILEQPNLALVNRLVLGYLSLPDKRLSAVLFRPAAKRAFSKPKKLLHLEYVSLDCNTGIELPVRDCTVLLWLLHGQRRCLTVSLREIQTRQAISSSSWVTADVWGLDLDLDWRPSPPSISHDTATSVIWLFDNLGTH
ncbi:hypothetical protein BJ546DRAFT_89112 [Cryomyces antarcticus]